MSPRPEMTPVSLGELELARLDTEIALFEHETQRWANRLTEARMNRAVVQAGLQGIYVGITELEAVGRLYRVRGVRWDRESEWVAVISEVHLNGGLSRRRQTVPSRSIAVNYTIHPRGKRPRSEGDESQVVAEG